VSTKDHYAPLDPSEASAAISDQDLVYLGPFCDEEHMREELTPLLERRGARLESQEHEEVGEHLFNAQLLSTSEGMWVGVEAVYGRGCSAEFTDYGFQVVPHYAAGNGLDSPVDRYRIHPLVSEGEALLRSAAISEYPGSGGPGDPADVAAAELRARGNTQQVTTRRLIVEQAPG